MKIFYKEGSYYAIDISDRYPSYIQITAGLPIKLRKGMVIFAGYSATQFIEVIYINEPDKVKEINNDDVMKIKYENDNS